MKKHIATLSIWLAATCGPLTAGDWPGFLGLDRNGICTETGLISEFPESGPEILWRTPLGVGMSGIAVVDGVAFTTWQDTQHQYAVALDAVTGKQIWKVQVSANYKNSMGNGPRATPTVSNGTVYVFSGEGILTALNAADGKAVWSTDTMKSVGGRPAEYGMASSPLVTKDAVIVHVGSTKGCVACFDAKSGDVKWTAGNESAGYSSPILATLAGKSQIVALVGAEVLGLDPSDGSTLWKYRFQTEYNCNTANPLVIDGSTVLISAGENHGSVILKITNDGGQFSVAEGWSSFGKDSVLRAEWQTPILTGDGLLYGLDNIGSAGPITNLVCVQAADGKQLWNQKRFGKSNLVAADGKLFMTTMKGEVVIGTATANGYKETARATVIGMTRQAPAIANGKLYIRDDKEVVCINIQSNK